MLEPPHPASADPRVPARRRPRFQYTLRALLVAVILLSFPLAWAAAQLRWAASQQAVRERLEKAGATIQYAETGDGNLRARLGKMLSGDARYFMPITTLRMAATDADMPSIGRLTTLRVLALSRSPRFAVCHVTDFGMRHLCGLTRMESLELAGANISDAGMAHLRGLRRLRTLSLCLTEVTDSGLVYLKGLSELEDLDLSRTRVKGIGLTHLAELGRLRRLDLSGLPIGDTNLRSLSGLRELESLDLDGAKITDRGLAEIGVLTKIVQLNIAVRENDRRMTELDAVFWRFVRPAHISDRGRADLRVLLEFRRSTAAEWRWSELLTVTQTGLAELEALSLGRTGNADLSPDGRAALSALIVRRRLFESSGESETAPDARPAAITDEGLRHLMALRGLKALDLSGTAVTDAGLPVLSAFPELECLNLSATKITDAGLAHLGELRQLRELRITGTAVTDGGLDPICALPGLQHLELAGTGVTYARVALIQRTTPIGVSWIKAIDLGPIPGAPNLPIPSWR